MTDRLAVALAQINPIVGDLEGNAALIRRVRAEAAEAGADLVLTPELAISGYPPEDLALKPFFMTAVEAAVETLAAETADGGPAILLGAPWREAGATYNAMLLLDGGQVATQRYKHDLPNYGVFDEKRVFAPGPAPGPIPFRGVRIGAPICEDIWGPDVVEGLEESAAEILLVANGSPFEAGKSGRRAELAVARVVESGLPLAYLNQVGGQDELVFDGGSFVIDRNRSLALQLPAFEPALGVARFVRGDEGWEVEPGPVASPPEELDAIWRAMVLGLRDYVEKNRFPGVIIGLSGGLDSALTAAVAVDALGAERVRCVMMPSPYTSEESLEEAADAARLLGVTLETASIEPAMAAFETILAPLLGGDAGGVTEENIQARARGMILMALSNKLGHMVLTTGNKSEMSVGYATLYGDMCGGFSVLKDVYKTSVYALARWRNRARPPGALGPEGRAIPERTITRAPSAELRPGQTDQDSLPPYEILDDILTCLIERDLGLEEILARGHDAAMVSRVWKMLDRAEYKRRQAPPGVKITARAFGRDRRYPITNRFTHLIER